ncbi:hypothetical cytosolic protein [Syntrophus aciditrophicus SB]|uniref:Hypothetical cytosolic protein n=1 Tax=Syntrophus aciditrophicus (strain SB) TaxID=56780 RepID=Q2LUT0_SYNAS|nr:hypothetical cytosolic protein [Syntrophus aciditrophicus SB]
MSQCVGVRVTCKAELMRDLNAPEDQLPFCSPSMTVISASDPHADLPSIFPVCFFCAIRVIP